VRSILGRYLEHSRVYAFCNDGRTDLFIGSADLMHRNLDRRVEELVRITDPAMVEDLEWLVTHCASDDVASWHLQPDGSWERHLVDAEGNVVIPAGADIGTAEANAAIEAGIEEITVRSVLTCDSNVGTCAARSEASSSSW